MLLYYCLRRMGGGALGWDGMAWAGLHGCGHCFDLYV